MSAVIPPVPQLSTAPWPRAPFPDMETHPLLVVDFAKIQAGDAAEIQTLITASTTLGFFYLKNHGVDPEPIFEVGQKAFAIPIEESLGYEMGDTGRTFGYKKAGGTNTDAAGNLDSVQFWNISTDDIRAFPEEKHRSYAPIVGRHMADPLHPFVKQNDIVCRTILGAFEPFLGLEAGTLMKLHENPACLCESEVRIIFKGAPKSGAFAAPVGADGKTLAAIGSHTDIGTFTVLHARGTGGLQVLPPGSPDWQWVKPLDGHVICNIADALSVFSGGILRSNTHRVLPAPGDQGLHDRWSLGYFLRPSFDSVMYPLVEQSAMIKDAAAISPMVKLLEEGVTAGQYVRKRQMLARTANRTGPESWKAYTSVADHSRDRDDI
ncbi:hypothetical protein RQP46_002742 [Phenoliferia psychrophenolica]